MFAPDDTIVAVATPAGHGGLGVVRLSGPAAMSITQAMARRGQPWAPRHATVVTLDAQGLAVEAVVTVFPGPASYTGDDVVEIGAHGSPVVLAAIVADAVRRGGRPARAGEFTLRAFVNGKLDLVQAEAVRDLVDAVSPAQARVAAAHLDGSLSSALGAVVTELRRLETLLEASMDFPDEGYRFIEPGDLTTALGAVEARIAALVATAPRGELVRDGARVVIAGVPNVGKSSVFNALVGADRAIVTPVAGTTRDLVSERLVLDGALVLLVDTAGLRDGSDVVEAEGVRRASGAIAGAALVLVVLDASRPLQQDEIALVASLRDRPALVVVNKCDLAPAWSPDELGVDVAAAAGPIAVSVRSGHGIAALATALAARVRALSAQHEGVLVTNERHRALLVEALEHVAHATAALAGAQGHLPEEFVVADLRGALRALEDVTGRRSSEALVNEIFSTFCIGK